MQHKLPLLLTFFIGVASCGEPSSLDTVSLAGSRACPECAFTCTWVTSGSVVKVTGTAVPFSSLDAVTLTLTDSGGSCGIPLDEGLVTLEPSEEEWVETDIAVPYGCPTTLENAKLLFEGEGDYLEGSCN